jgi:hypothetical protein
LRSGRNGGEVSARWERVGSCAKARDARAMNIAWNSEQGGTKRISRAEGLEMGGNYTHFSGSRGKIRPNLALVLFLVQ